MKKFIALILLAITCLTFVACSKDNSDVYIGKWTAKGDKIELVINEDKTGEIKNDNEAIKFTWFYDKNSSMMVIVPEKEDTNIQSFTYFEEIDTLYNPWYTFKRVK